MVPNNTVKQFPLEGFIAANGVTDFETDPYISTVDAYFAQNAIPLDLYNNWKQEGCKVYWQGVMHDNLPGNCTKYQQKVNDNCKHMYIYDMLVMNYEDIPSTSPKSSPILKQ